ncbi:MAG TPA: hypothetical protein VNH53_03870 [Sphingomicrobium sp.]|nr:hypothetical protein [Sphingomicrobium sp.]
MPHSSALRQHGARRAVSGPAGARPFLSRATEQRLAELGDLSGRLDQLIADVSLQVRSHREVDRQIEEAEAIAERLRALFRGSSSIPQQHPPLAQRGGQAIW